MPVIQVWLLFILISFLTSRRQMKRKIVIVDHREEGYEMEKKAFAATGEELVISNCRNEDELLIVVRDAFVIIFTCSKFSRKVIDQLTNCKLLIRYGVGLDNVDIRAASEKGIYVCNTPNYGTFAVAEHAFGLLLALNRRLNTFDHNVRNHVWGIENVAPVHSLRYKTLGILGFGNIGHLVSRMAHSFEMRVIINDPFIDEETAAKYYSKSVTFNELIVDSDHISVHAPLNDETHHLFHKDVFRKMRKSSTLINTSRGGLINQPDLINALRSGLIAGAGLDVFENEPLDQGNELLTMDNVLLTPHVAWYTEESIINLHQEVIDEVLLVLGGNNPQNCVNNL
jgi:D-3-phosphoglycerate dehydrogenase / 2-oxoglutarate reductase